MGRRALLAVGRVIWVLSQLVSIYRGPRTTVIFRRRPILRWLANAGIDTALIASGEPSQDVSIEFFNGRFGRIADRSALATSHDTSTA